MMPRPTRVVMHVFALDGYPSFRRIFFRRSSFRFSLVALSVHPSCTNI